MVAGMVHESYTCRMISSPTHENILAAAQILRMGGIVGVPTETVYGLAGCIDRPEAIDEIFRRKGRPQDNPLIVHVADVEMARDLARAEGADALLALGKVFWPGPLTIVVPSVERVPMNVRAGLDTVAIRIPAHPVFQDLLRSVGCPLAAPSANVSGRPSPTRAEHVRHDMGDDVCIVDGGSCQHGIESTVVRVIGDTIHVLRPGAVRVEDLQSVAGFTVLPSWNLASQAAPASPGMKYRHYAPEARMHVCYSLQELHHIVHESDQRTLVLAPKHWISKVEHDRVHVLETSTLYNELRQADLLQTAMIVVLCDDAVLADEALMNRLTKAAGIEKRGL